MFRVTVMTVVTTVSGDRGDRVVMTVVVTVMVMVLELVNSGDSGDSSDESMTCDNGGGGNELEQQVRPVEIQKVVCVCVYLVNLLASERPQGNEPQMSDSTHSYRFPC
jgi:hypothetical protein